MKKMLLLTLTFGMMRVKLYCCNNDLIILKLSYMESIVTNKRLLKLETLIMATGWSFHFLYNSTIRR